MKKSFLKRVTAAVIALPVALSQTVLFASFAEGESSSATDAITLDTFLSVPANQALYTPQSGEVYRAFNAQQTKDGNNSNYQYFIQESNWNAKLSQAVLSYSGLVDEENNVHTFDLDATEFIQYINGDTWYADMIRNALADPVNQAYVNVYSDGIDFVAHVNNYSYEKFAMDILNRSIPESYKNVDFTFQSDGAVDAKVVISADTTALGDGAGKAARTVPYTIEIEWDGKKLTTVQQVYDKILSVIEQVRQDTKDSVAAKFKTYEDEKEAAQKALDDAKAEGAPADVIAEKQAELDAKANKLDNAHRMVDFKVDEIVDDYVERINNAKQKYDNQIAKDLDREVTKEDVDAVLGRLNQIVENNVNNQRVNNAFPANLSEFAGKNYYGTLNKIFYNVLEQINKQTGEKSTSGTVYNINLTLQEVLDKAAELYDVTVYDKHVAGEESIDGYAYAYLDEDEDTAPIEKLINEKLAAENLKLKENSLYTIKAVEVEGDGDIQNGSSVLDVYRIIRFETEEVEETTTVSETTTETTETTASTEATEETTETTASTETTEETTETTAATTESGEGTGTAATTESGEGTGTAATTESGEGTGTAATTESGESTETTAATEATETTTESGVVSPTDTTESEPVFIDSIEIRQKYIDGDGSFYFAHDPNAFEVTELVDFANSTATDKDGNVATLDPAKITFGTVENGEEVGLNPKALYDRREAGAAYVKNTLLVYYDGRLVKGTADVYIGVKGDADLSGKADATDAASVLIYAARAGAGEENHIYTDKDEVLDKFAFFLADTTDESKDLGVTSGIVGKTEKSALNAEDAANILNYSAKAGANGTCDWIPEVLLSAPYPKYSQTIAEKAGLLSSNTEDNQ